MSVHIRKTALPHDLYNADPSAPTVTPTNGNAGSYTYKLVGITANGNHTAASSGASIADGPDTLSETDYNEIDPTGISAPGVESWDVYRTVGGATQGKIGNIPNDGSTTLIDDGLGGDASTAPNTNTTGLGAPFQVNHFSHSTIWLAGTFSGSVQLQLSTDDGVTWDDEGSPLTTAGTVDVTRLADLMRAKMTAYTSGTITLNLRGLDRA